ncbi:DUF5689 domain-containing protein [Croceitalea sp. MTPC9]|uniref:DUF5689 domain-containing protein n=1 Tax=unclassified Croceitalea TaxID=2632280 RepID=UPI002B3D00EB|nr:DUF5689 domain-containing protein [Croceitalea sp. MTPC6]GMN16832.1 DUF5689 domain-containing protein [Croceitalea sp. MTPC9]
MKRQIFILVFLIILTDSCVKNTEFDSISSACSDNLIANATFAQVKDLYQDELVQIQEDLIIEGYVISSDKAGNFFSVLHFQDSPTDPTEGFQIEIDLRESHLFFEVGSRILIKLKGLYLGQSRGVFKLGGTFAAFGTTSVGRLPALKIPEHIFLSCDNIVEVQPSKSSITDLRANQVNTLIQIDSLEFIVDEFGLPFAELREETERTLRDCNGDEVKVLNSGFSDFQSEILPEANGTITAVLLQENTDFLLVIRDLDDINFSNQRCVESQTTSTQIFFSELADPNNNSSARFVELYNASSEPIDLEGWSLRRYTNANTEVSSTIDLTGLNIGAESTFVISPNAQEFELVYGFPPDLGVSTNSPADSNGDDNLELVDPFGTVIDVFGVVGEDGSSTNHEFEDGRAVRNLEISEANAIYTFSEWTIFNDMGNAGTTNLPQNAPEDFTPGSRE